MTSRQAGRRMNCIAQEYHRRRPAPSPAAKGTPQDTIHPSERRRLLQLMVCCGIFVSLVAVKLLLPSQMAQLNTVLSDALHQNMDVQAVFSAVGRAVSGEEDAQLVWNDVYQAVFRPQDDAVETSAAETAIVVPQPSALETLRIPDTSADSEPTASADTTTDTTADQTDTSYLLYSDQNLPDNVQMEQAVLGFSYCTPVSGVLSSNFGYRSHPTEGDERFHYGVDLAADTGTAVSCFADGTVTAVGESSSYGKYLMVSHPGNYTTLYAHCSRVTAASGASVKEGEKIAEVGETGIATGPHLHFELHHNSDYLNPIYYVTTA